MSGTARDIADAPERLRGWARALATLALTAATVVAAGLFLPSSARSTPALALAFAFMSFLLFVGSACVLVLAGVYNPREKSDEARTDVTAYANEILPKIRRLLTVSGCLAGGAVLSIVIAIAVGLLASSEVNLSVHRTGAAPETCPGLPPSFTAKTTRSEVEAQGQAIRLEVRGCFCLPGRHRTSTIWLPRNSLTVSELE